MRASYQYLVHSDSEGSNNYGDAMEQNVQSVDDDDDTDEDYYEQDDTQVVLD